MTTIGKIIGIASIIIIIGVILWFFLPYLKGLFQRSKVSGSAVTLIVLAALIALVYFAFQYLTNPVTAPAVTVVTTPVVTPVI